MKDPVQSRRTLFLLVLLAVASGAGCAPKYYAPNAQNVPLVSERGEGSVALSINPDLNRFDARGALALTDAVGLLANTALYFPKDTEDGDGGSGHLFEIGAGHFRPLSPGLLFEAYALLGYGKVENHFSVPDSGTGGTLGEIEANVARIAVQPSLGYRQGNFKGAVSSRFAMLNYSGVSGNLVANGEDQIRYLRDNGRHFLFEPALTLRAGAASLKAELQVGGSVNLTDGDFPQDNTWASLGFVYAFGRR